MNVTDNIKKMTNKAEGAGIFGRWLLWIGGVVLTFGSMIVGIYTNMTDHTPP